MVWQISKIAMAAGIISFTSWLSGRQPKVAGFLLALPLSTMIALIFSYTEYQDAEKSAAFAKSIFTGIPISLLFFIPFLLAEKLQWGFFALYLTGIVLLGIGYWVHTWLFAAGG